MDRNKEAARRLEFRIAQLADHLEYFEAQPKREYNEQTNNRIENLRLLVVHRLFVDPHHYSEAQLFQ